jgi:hypothetical protein
VAAPGPIVVATFAINHGNTGTPLSGAATGHAALRGTRSSRCDG